MIESPRISTHHSKSAKGLNASATSSIPALLLSIYCGNLSAPLLPRIIPNLPQRLPSKPPRRNQAGAAQSAAKSAAARRMAGHRPDDVIRDLSALGTEARCGQCRESRARHVRRPSVRRGERPSPTPRDVLKASPTAYAELRQARNDGFAPLLRKLELAH